MKISVFTCFAAEAAAVQTLLSDTRLTDCRSDYWSFTLFII